MLGGWLFSNKYLQYPEEVEDCSLQNINANNRFDNLAIQVNSLAGSTYSACLATMSSIFETIDVNNDEVIDKCEHARALAVLGNTGSYSLTYSGYGSKSYMQKKCKHITLDGFDAVYEPYPDRDHVLRGLGSLATGIFPLHLFFDIGKDLPEVTE